MASVFGSDAIVTGDLAVSVARPFRPKVLVFSHIYINVRMLWLCVG